MPSLWIAALVASMMGCTGSSDPGPPEPLAHPFDDAVGIWYDAEGEPLSRERPLVMQVYRGSQHCGWQDLIFLLVSSPLGSEIPGAYLADERTRTFVRLSTSDDLPIEYFAATFDADADLPSNARDTGFHRDGWHLWVVDDRIDRAVWLVRDEIVERWPAMTEQVACA
jgi:hypothetical protein